MDTLPRIPATVLVVDDDPRNRKLLATILKADGYEVREAADGEAALAEVAAELPATVLLDVMMPGLDGFTVCRRLKEDPATAHLPVILVTALAGRDDRLAGMEAGADDFLTKPVDSAELRLRVRNAVRVKQLFDDNLALRRGLEEQVAAKTRELQNAYRLLESRYRELAGRDRLVRCQMAAPTLAEAGEEIRRVVAEVVGGKASVFLCEGGGGLSPLAPAGAPLPPAPAVARVLAGRSPDPLDGTSLLAAVVHGETPLACLWVTGLDESGDLADTGAVLQRLAGEAALLLEAARTAEELASGQLSLDELVGLSLLE